MTAFRQGDWRTPTVPEFDTPLEERRQRAREAFYDTPGRASGADTALTEAIETATRVRITDEAVFRVFTELHKGATARAVIHVALEELGFEVEV